VECEGGWSWEWGRGEGQAIDPRSPCHGSVFKAIDHLSKAINWWSNGLTACQARDLWLSH
jgi:hypothetical protein